MAFNLGATGNTGKLSMSDFLGTTPAENGETKSEKEKDIPIEQLVPWENQPFKMYTEAKLNELADSIKENGLLSRILVTPIGGGKYRILAGHNRVEACRRAGMTSVPSMIMDVDENRQKLIMTDTNLCQRQELLPSERIFAYKAQQEALLALGSKRATADMAEKYGVDRKTIQRYISCARLAPELLDLLDENRVNLTSAVSFSKMPQDSQKEVAAYFTHRPDASISNEQAQEIAELEFVSESDIAELYDEEEETPQKTATTTEAKGESDEQQIEKEASTKAEKKKPNAKQFSKKITLNRSEVTEIIGDELTNDEIAEFFYYCLQQKDILTQWHESYANSVDEPITQEEYEETYGTEYAAMNDEDEDEAEM